MSNERWNSESLSLALQGSEAAMSGALAIELLPGADDVIVATMAAYGDLEVIVNVGSEQILAQVLLWPATSMKDQAAFNTMALRTHKLMPLSTFGITKGADGQDYYELFGALSVSSKLENILLELEVLAANAIEAVQAYSEDRM